MRHLDEATYRALLSGSLVADRELRGHLASGCEACVAFLEQRPSLDALDGHADRIALQGARAQPIPAQELDSILAALQARRRRRNIVPVLGAVAALAVAVIGVSISQHRASTADGIKGDASITLSASFVVVHPDGKTERGRSGEAVADDAMLAIRADVSRPAHLALVRSGAGGSEVLLVDQPVSAGPHELMQGGDRVAISLKGLLGTQHVLLLASPAPLTSEQALAAARGEVPEGVARTGFDVLVASSVR